MTEASAEPEAGAIAQPEAIQAIMVPIEDLKPHPRNYRSHPDDQLEHIIQSIRDNGFYRNIVVTQDGVILAGHGVVEASKKLGIQQVPVITLPIDADDPRALKVLAGDNMVSHLAQDDDRMLTELLKELSEEQEAGLLGTGFDDMMLANLLMVTRPETEIADIDEAAEWVGMPDHDPGELQVKLVIQFRSEADRTALLKKLDQADIDVEGKATISTWYPPKERNDLASLEWSEEQPEEK